MPETDSASAPLLYIAPGACSFVPLVALEEISAPFETVVVAFKRGDHRSSEYLALNPKGKVPTLVVNGNALTENVAILSYLAKVYSNADVLPFGKGEIKDAHILADLAWCSSGLHPVATRLRRPQFFCDSDEAAIARTRALASDAMASNLAVLEQRLSGAPWMLGERWSIIDAYIFWLWSAVAESGFDLAPYSRLADHGQRVARRPSVQRALARDAAAQSWLKDRGLAVEAPAKG